MQRLESISSKRDWDRTETQKQSHMGFCIGEGLFFAAFPLFPSLCVSHPLPFSLCLYETSILERGRDFGRLPISSSPWRPRDQATNESTHIHTLLAATEENSLALCCTENPTFPSIRQTGRQLGVTLNPFPHVCLPNKGLALPVTSLFLLLSLFHASSLEGREESQLWDVYNYDMIVQWRVVYE